MNVLIMMRYSHAFRFVPGRNRADAANAFANVSCTRSSASARFRVKEAVMAVLRYEPFRDPFDRLMSLAATGSRSPLGMPLDIYRTDDGSYHVEADLPGVDPGSIDVTVEHAVLTIRAERGPGYGEGVLHVTIPASPKVQPRRIDVSHAPADRRTVPKAAAKK
jgi:HSP20 family molecular chaperone IbpA